MTFGAMAAWQAWLLLAACGAVAAWLFLLKLRPPRITVPSLLLWQRVLDASRELTLWERIRRMVSLAVTLVIALALALAVTRPSRVEGTTSASRGRLLIVIDSSWSMLARTRTGETRWDRAVAEARRLAAGADEEVALATTADGLIAGPTTDLAIIESGLDLIAPAASEPTYWPPLIGAESVHFITDGGLARPLDPVVVVHSVFEPAANVAITAFDVRPSLTPDRAGDAYLEIANFAPAPQRVRLKLTRGSASIVERDLELSAGEILRQLVPIVRGPEASLRAHVEARNDALEIDDDAVAWSDRATPLMVTVVGQHTGWLGRLFSRDPNVRATFVDPADYQVVQKDQPGQADVLLFDRWAPPEPPARPALFFAPPTDTPWLNGGRQGTAVSAPDAAAEEKRPQWQVAGSHPVVRGVDPLTLAIEKARPYRAPDLVPVAVSARGTPLVYISESSGTPRSRTIASASQTDAHVEGRRLVIVTFGPGESNLTSAPGFPVLVGNALDWLTRSGQAIGARQPGPMWFDDGIAKVTGPRGAPVPLLRMKPAVSGVEGPDAGLADEGHSSAIGVLRTPGLYVADGGGARSTIAVNVGDPQVSNLGRTSLSAADQAKRVTAGASRRPWWAWCAGAAFALALVEWWTWQRRITV